MRKKRCRSIIDVIAMYPTPWHDIEALYTAMIDLDTEIDKRFAYAEVELKQEENRGE